MVRAINRKLLRDLRHLRGQVLTVGLVVACGIASYVTLQSTWQSLESSKNAYYLRYRFGDVFVHLKRAPQSVRQELEHIPGVAEVYDRITENVTLPLADLPQPPLAQVVSLPPEGQPPLGRLYLQAGRLVEQGRVDEVVLLTKFAERSGLVPGDTLPAVINGELRRLRVVGLASSPEFVYPMPPGGSAGVDDQRFAVLWMDRGAIAPAFQMEGAFNDLVLRMEPGASEKAVLRDVDRALDRYGGLAAVGRSRQPSNDILEEEMGQLRTWATIVPLIFLSVSAFLVNVVLSRLVQLQRPEIATLKAVGYGDREIGFHYLKLVSVVVFLGAALGIGLGAWLGRGLTGVYAGIFRFPFAVYRLGLEVPLVACALSFGTALIGAVGTVRRIALLPPAEAMRPPTPAVYRPLLIERLGVPQLISPAGRMIVRELERRPLRTVLSVLGVATALATLVVGQFSGDAFAYLIELQFSRISREDLTVVFRESVPRGALDGLAHLPGVRRVEGIRAVPVRLEGGPRSREITLFGLPDDAELRKVVSRATQQPVPLPTDGLLLTKTLADLLGLVPGDSVAVRTLEGKRRSYRVLVAGLVDEVIGLQGYMRLPALSSLLGEEPVVSNALLAIDHGSEHDVIRRLNDMPGILNVTSRAASVAQLRKQSGQSMAVVTLVLTVFAATIAVSVVYNNARVALSMRSRDFASLRVLGFTRGEISRTLLAELGAEVLLAVPVGLVLGTWLTSWVLSTAHPERYRFPLMVSPGTYAFAVSIVLASSAVSGLLVRRQLDRLDLIGVLKTRE